MAESLYPTHTNRTISPSDDIKYRSAIFERELGADNKTVELSFSSEIEYEQYRGVFEVLSHTTDAVVLSRLNNGAPLLFNHNFDLVVGVVVSIRASREGGDHTS